ncbi:CopG family ribbon-helix-helix protein [Sphingomonas sp. PB4P5]|uniref:CopG family ribbon-helix-helix protein n=1 Tax=Parasphingomonas puruogangriensis TaxID=3096155 RepID=UPI002FC6B4F1
MPFDSTESAISRLSLSLPADVFRQLDVMVAERGLSNRSQIIVELIRQELDHYGARDRPNDTIAGTMTLIYRAESGEVRHALALAQAKYLKEVISSQHVFLEDDQSLEVLLVQGPAHRLDALCDALRSIRGVQQLNFVATTSLLRPLHAPGEATPSVGTSE